MRYLFARTIAYLLDCLICFSVVMMFLQWAILSNIRKEIGLTEEWFQNSWNLELYVLLTISLPVWLYFTYFDSNRSFGTIGKRFAKLQVVNHDKGQVGLKRSFLRTILKLAPWEISHIGVVFPEPLYFMHTPDIRPLTFIGLILFTTYFISITIGNDRQSFYDMLLKTRVIEK